MDIKDFKPSDADRLPTDGFFIYVSSRSGAGKTHLITWLLSLPRFRSKFHACLVLSPTSNIGDYKQFEMVSPEYHHSDSKQIPDILNQIKQTAKEVRKKHGIKSKFLVIIDDFLTDSRSMGQTNRALNEFVSVRRHYGCAMVMISQRIQACSPSIRNQCSMFISFSPRTVDDRTFIVKNFLTRELINNSTKETLSYANEILDTVFSKSPYAALVVDCIGQSAKMLDNVWSLVAPAKIKKYKLRLKKPRGRGVNKKLPSDAQPISAGGMMIKNSPADALSFDVIPTDESASEEEDDVQYLNLG